MIPTKVLRSEFFGDQVEEDSEILKKISTSRHAGPFLIGKELGRGITGSVRLGTHAETGFKVALKIVKKKYLNKNPERWSTLRREIAVMKVTEHPNIVKLYDVFETQDKIYLVTELLTGGELFDYIPREGLSRHESLRILGQITSALLHCHEYGIVHRDLKPENLLMDEHHNVKLGDFGMARCMKDGSMLKTSCGSPHYASPEVIADGKYDGKRSDVWSLGVILFAMVSGMLPFDHQNIPTLLSMVKKGVYEMPDSLDDDVKDLINSMIQVDLSKRIRMEDILRHPAFRKSGIVSSSLPSPSRSPFSSPFPSPHSPRSPDSPLSSPTSRASTQRTDNDGDTKMSDSDNHSILLDESLLDDLVSLGWDSKEELRLKLLQPEPSQEKSLYYHLKRRRRTRIEELHRLSPLPIRRRFYSVSTSSAPGTPNSHLDSFDSRLVRRSSFGPPSMDSLPPTAFAKIDDTDMSISSFNRLPENVRRSLQAKTHRRPASVPSSPYSQPPFFPRQSSEPGKTNIPSPSRQGNSQVASEIALKLFTLANEGGAMKPTCARRLFQTPQVRPPSSHQVGVYLPSAPSDSRRLPAIPDRVSSGNSPVPSSPRRIPVHIQPKEAEPMTESPIQRWFSGFFKRRPSLDPWKLSGATTTQNQTQTQTLSNSLRPTEHSPQSMLSTTVRSSSPSPSVPLSFSSTSSPSTSVASSFSSTYSPSTVSRERSSSLPTNIFNPQSPPPPKPRSINSEETQYRTLARKKESKPSQRASSAFLNFSKDEFNETIKL